MRRRIAFLMLAALLAVPAFAADLTGTWEAEVKTDQGGGNPSFTLKQAGDQLTGTYSGQFGQAPLTGKVSGKTIEFRFEVSGAEVVYKGTIESDDSLKGTADYAGGAVTGTWTARRKKQ